MMTFYKMPNNFLKIDDFRGLGHNKSYKVLDNLHYIKNIPFG